MTAPFSAEAILASPTVLRREPRVVRFQDVDAATTVFFPRYFEYASDVYVAHLAAAGIAMRSMLEAREMAIPLRHVESDFRAPLFFGDAFVTELCLAQVGTTSFSLGFRVLGEDGKRVHAVVQTVHVCIDMKTGKPIAVPDAVRAAFVYQG